MSSTMPPCRPPRTGDPCATTSLLRASPACCRRASSSRRRLVGTLFLLTARSGVARQRAVRGSRVVHISGSYEEHLTIFEDRFTLTLVPTGSASLTSYWPAYRTSTPPFYLSRGRLLNATTGEQLLADPVGNSTRCPALCYLQKNVFFLDCRLV